jgi:hypothetical protein
MFFTRVSRMDLDRFRTDVSDRVRPAEDRVDRAGLPLHPEAKAAIDAAIAIATEHRREVVRGVHLLSVLMRAGDGATADLLARYGGSAAAVTAELEGAL